LCPPRSSTGIAGKIEVKRNAELLIGSLFTSDRPDLKIVVKVLIE